MSRLSTLDEDPLVEERLAFLALTSEIDLFSHEVSKSTKFLDDADHELLSRLYVAHLMPAASSFWWNDGNAVLAKTRLLGQRYPRLRTKQWRQSASKTRIVLRRWRKDSLRLFPDLTDGLCNDFGRINDESDKEEGKAEDDYIIAANTRSKRKMDEVDAMISKKARKLTISPPISPGINSSLENQCVSTPARPPHRTQTNLITPPQSGESTPVIVISDDEDSDDEDPIPMRRRRRPVSRPMQTLIAAAAYRSHLSFSPAQTVVSIQPVEDPRYDPACATNLDGELEVASKACDGQFERNKTDCEIKKLRKKVKSLTKMVKKLNMEMQA